MHFHLQISTKLPLKLHKCWIYQLSFCEIFPTINGIGRLASHIIYFQEISNRTVPERTPKKPKYLIARLQLTERDPQFLIPDSYNSVKISVICWISVSTIGMSMSFKKTLCRLSYSGVTVPSWWFFTTHLKKSSASRQIGSSSKPKFAGMSMSNKILRKRNHPKRYQTHVSELFSPGHVVFWLFPTATRPSSFEANESSDVLKPWSHEANQDTTYMV